MSESSWESLVEQLRNSGIKFEAGLTDEEVDATEKRFSFRFPPDLRAFLQTGLPHGEHFPNWRSGDESSLRYWLDLPLEGVLFDVEHNGFWLDEWGPRPSTLAAASKMVTALIASAPVLIPIFMHRMMPAEPCEAGNPVFSVHQTDIICYGADLRDYLIHEFLPQEMDALQTTSRTIRQIRFWDIDHFQEVRWSDGPCEFDNREGLLP